MKIKRVHHLTIAVRDADAARLTFSRVLGVDAGPPAASVQAFGIGAAQLPLGDTTLELAAPIGAENPLLRFIERKGEGFYNLALEVDDLDAAVQDLASLGVRASEPVLSGPGMRSAFVTMAATHGLSIQLLELSGAAAAGPRPDEQPPDEPPERDAGLPEAAAASDAPPETAGSEAAQTPPPLDLTPDEWSDTD